MEHMQTNSTTAMTEQQAQQLLGTLSRQPGDIHAAYRHRYHHCVMELSRSDDAEQHVPLETQLWQLRQAKSLLLAELVEETPPPIAADQEQTTAKSEQRSDIQSDQPSPRRPLKVMTAAMLTLLVSATSVLAGLLWNQNDQIHQLQQNLSASQAQQQQLRQQHNNLQDTLALNLQQHNDDRLRWHEIQQQQRLQLQQQLALIEQQQQSSRQLQQQLNQVDKQLLVERNQSMQLQLQINRLNQQSVVLIDELCSDSAAVTPALSETQLPSYLNRCRLLWSLASD